MRYKFKNPLPFTTSCLVKKKVPEMSTFFLKCRYRTLRTMTMITALTTSLATRELMILTMHIEIELDMDENN